MKIEKHESLRNLPTLTSASSKIVRDCQKGDEVRTARHCKDAAAIANFTTGYYFLLIYLIEKHVTHDDRIDTDRLRDDLSLSFST